MVVLVITVVTAARMRMSGTVRTRMSVLVEHDLQPPAERRGDAAKGVEARNMIAALQPRDHRFRHTQAQRQLFLRFAGISAELDEPPRIGPRAQSGRLTHRVALSGDLTVSWSHFSKNATSSDVAKIAKELSMPAVPASAQELLD